MQLTEDIKRAIMREMGSKGGKANTKSNLSKAGKRSAEVRRLKRLQQAKLKERCG